MNKPMVLVNLALGLLILNLAGNILYAYYLGVEVNVNSLFPRLAVMMFLFAMVHLEKNWARFLVGILACVAGIGMLASLILHFYTGKEGLPNPIEIAGFILYSISGYLLLIPKSVRTYFHNENNGNIVT